VTPEQLGELEKRLPPLDSPRLPAIAAYLESLPQKWPLTGELQGEVLHLAGRIRELASKIAA
jgi:hypothetical protein